MKNHNYRWEICHFAMRHLCMNYGEVTGCDPRFLAFLLERYGR